MTGKKLHKQRQKVFEGVYNSLTVSGFFKSSDRLAMKFFLGQYLRRRDGCKQSCYGTR